MFDLFPFRRGAIIRTFRSRRSLMMEIAIQQLAVVKRNIIHFLRPATCFDCFFPYGLPFTFYRDGGFAGGGGLVLRGLAADAATVIAIAVLLGTFWEHFAAKRS